MKAYIEQLLRSVADPIAGRNLVREYLQARILENLQSAGAMVPLAFHGGTALRFLYAIHRFSEDLDFALEKPGADYDFRAYLPRQRERRKRSMKRIISRQFLTKARRPSRKGTRRGPNFKAKTMTQPERDFLVRLLMPMTHAGEIDHVRFQAMTFESGQGSKYTPEFTARRISDNVMLAYEIKGAYVYEDSIIKFKGCVLLYPEWLWYWCQQDAAGKWEITLASATQEPDQIQPAARGPYKRRRPPDRCEGEGVKS